MACVSCSPLRDELDAAMGDGTCLSLDQIEAVVGAERAAKFRAHPFVASGVADGYAPRFVVQILDGEV